MKKLSVAAILFFSIISAAFAGGWGSYTTTITGFYVWSNGSAHFRVANPENPDGCTTPQYLTLDSTAPNFKLLYANLMMAYSQGLTVRLAYGGCTSGGNYPLITSIAIPSIW